MESTRCREKRIGCLVGESAKPTPAQFRDRSDAACSRHDASLGVAHLCKRVYCSHQTIGNRRAALSSGA